jgi:protein-tyrosine phosphatase
MPSDIYWIDTKVPIRLAIMARPRAGDWLDEEVANWRRSGVDVVASLLEHHEVTELGLEEEPALCMRHGIEFRSFPIRDRGLPDDAEAAMRFAETLAQSGKAVAIHCRAGIGRSSLMAAAVLICRGVYADVALAAIEAARGLPIPDTDAQCDWVLARDRR